MSSSLHLQHSSACLAPFFEWFLRWEVNGRTAALLEGAASSAPLHGYNITRRKKKVSNAMVF